MSIPSNKRASNGWCAQEGLQDAETKTCWSTAVRIRRDFVKFWITFGANGKKKSASAQWQTHTKTCGWERFFKQSVSKTFVSSLSLFFFRCRKLFWLLLILIIIPMYYCYHCKYCYYYFHYHFLFHLFLSPLLPVWSFPTTRTTAVSAK